MQRVLMISTLALAIAVSVSFGQKPPAPKSRAEGEAYNAIVTAPDPDSRIKAAEAFLLKYADTELKSIALFIEAVSYQQKNDYEKMVIYAERTIEADPKHYAAMLMLAKGIALRSREFDLDKEEKLTRAEKLANQALELLKDATKPNPQITDEQWAEGKKEYLSQAHQALGYAAQTRKKYDVAMSEMQTAVEQAPDQVTMVKLAQVYNINNKPDEALAMLDKLNAMPDIHPTIRSFAQAERVRATQLKGGGAKPPAVPQVEIKKQ